MRLHLFWIVLLLLIAPVSATVNGVTIIKDGNEITTVPVSNTPVEREVELWFRISPSFDSGTIDASKLTTSFGEFQKNIQIDMSECSTESDVTFCKQKGIKLKTFRTSLPISFTVMRDGVETVESFNLLLNADGNGPTIKSFLVNDCSNDCYVKTGINTFKVGITDPDGISLDLIPIDLTGSNFILPSYCAEGICHYSTSNLACVDGSRITFSLNKNRVLDNIGNGLSETKTISAICDSAPPLITSEPALVDLGPLGRLVDSAKIVFRAKVSDTTRVSMKIDFTAMDGVVYENECVFTEEKNQNCEVEARSPPGPQTGQVKVTLSDGAGNAIERLIPIEVFGYEDGLVPQVQIKNIHHQGSVSRMLVTAMGLRSDQGVSYPVFFDLDPEIGQIVHVEVENCNEGITDGLPSLAATQGYKHRLDFTIDTSYRQNTGDIECNLLVFIKAGNKIFRTPTPVTLTTNLEIKGTDFETPGTRVHKKLSDGNNNALKTANLIEKLQNLMPVLSSICSINKAVGVAEQVGAAIETAGLVTQYIDGGALKNSGFQIADMALRIHKKIGDHGDDINNQEARKNLERAGQSAREFSETIDNAEKVFKEPDNIGKFSGWAKKACNYITCANMFEKQDLMSMADVSGFRDAADAGWDQLSAPNPGDSLLFAYEQGCYPALLKKANDIGQYICAEQYCLKSMAANGGDLSICSNIKAEGICREVVGAGVEMAAYQLGGTTGDVITAIKNLRERIVGVTINAGIALGTSAAGSVAKQIPLINQVTFNCQEREADTGDAKIISCHIPYAIRLFIQANEQSSRFGEYSGPSSNLCTAATCEGNACIGVIPTSDTVTAEEVFIHRDSPPLTNAEIAALRVKITGMDLENSAFIGGFGIPSFTTEPYPEFVSLTDDVQVQKSLYEQWEREGVLDTYKGIAKGDIKPQVNVRELELLKTYNDHAMDYDSLTPERKEEIINILQDTKELSDKDVEFLNKLADSETLMNPDDLIGLNTKQKAVWDEYQKLKSEQYKGLEAPLVETSEDWNKVVPACAVDNSYCDSEENMYFRDGKTLVYDSTSGKFKAIYDPDNLPGTYNLYRQAGSRYFNQYFEKYVVGDIRNKLQSLVNRLDPYSAIEDNFCKLANNIDAGDSPEVFEMTSNGLKQFHFNAEKQKIGDEWYYTLVYFIQGFNDREKGYSYIIRLKGNGPTTVLGQGVVLKGQNFRPDTNDPNFKSVRAFQYSQEYDQLCFEFRPAVTDEFLDVGSSSDSQEFCRRLSSTAFSGLGDAYNPGNNLLSYGSTTQNIVDGGVRWN